mgnify:FL=1
MNPLLKVLGLMSGTSLDGLDIALVEIYETQNNFHIKNVEFKTYPYNDEIRKKLLKNINPDTSRLDELCELNFELGDIFTDYILKFCADLKIKPEEIDLIGSHGQTFYHYIKNGKATSTLQMGEPSVIAQKTGITTVGDFRPADISAGGEGAPLVPFVDYLLFHNYKKSFALQNIGGIANVTYIPHDGDLTKVLAFDTGPGNMIIDSLVHKLSNGKLNYDEDGKWAARGEIDSVFLKELLTNNYFKLSPPKSTGRELFGEHFCQNIYQKSKI